jgi:hypothetical protein
VSADFARKARPVKTPTLPAELANADLAALVLPFGESIAAPNPHAGLSYRWGDVRLPRGEVPIDVDHDERQVGFASSFVLTNEGVWARLKLGKTAERLLGDGFTGVSPTIAGDQITGVSLTRSPGFESARLWLGDQGAPTHSADLVFLHVSENTVAIGPRQPPAPSTVPRPAIDLGAHRRELAELTMAAVERAVVRDRERFRLRREELARESIEREELALIAAGVPIPMWPEHLPKRQQFAAHEAQWAADRVSSDGEVAAREFAERMAQLEAEAERERRRPWWRRLFK